MDHFKEHTLKRCPKCHSLVEEPIKTYTRYVEDIPPVEKPEVTKHTLHGYWCSTCRKVVFPTLTDALPNAMIGLNVVVLTAWLHYLLGVSVNNMVKLLSVLCRFRISAGGLTQAWINLAHLLELFYRQIEERISQSRESSTEDPALLEQALVIPINSPPYSAPYNGAIEQSQGEFKSYLRRWDWKADTIKAFGLPTEIAAHALNHEHRRCLKGLTACRVYFGYNRIRYPTPKSRENILL